VRARTSACTAFFPKKTKRKENITKTLMQWADTRAGVAQLNSNRLGTTSNSFDVYVNKILAAGFAVIQYDTFPEGTIPFTAPSEVIEVRQPLDTN
jgi:hypothetical protein